MKMPSEAFRAYLYNVALALQPIAIIYGATSSDKAALWVAALPAVLGLSLARANTTTKTT